MITTQSPQSTFDTVDPGVSYEWIQSLPPELKDAALYRFCNLVERHTTLVESFTLNQILYRTISGNTFTESAESVAERTGCDRKTILKGLAQAVEQNILEENKRPGTSNEYSFKPVEEWLSEPVRKTDIRTKKVIEFPKQQESAQDFTVIQDDSVLTEPVRNMDDHSTDSNNNIVVVSLKDLEEQQHACSVPATDTPLNPSPWKYVGQGIGRVYMPPELDADTGKKIESIHEATKEPRPIIIKRAVDLLHNHLNRIPNYPDEKQKVLPTRVGAVISLPKVEELSPQGIPEDVYISLQQAEIELGLATAERLWTKYQEKFADAIAYCKAQDEAGKIKQSKEGFFRRSLEEGWNLTLTDSKPATEERKQPPRGKLTQEQQQWYEWACSTGVCDGRPVTDLAQAWNGELGVFVYMPMPNPMIHPWMMRPISAAMREFPMK